MRIVEPIPAVQPMKATPGQRTRKTFKKRSVIFRWLRHERSGKCFLTHCWGPDEIRVLQGGAG
jgi:hypothetical protein